MSSVSWDELLRRYGEMATLPNVSSASVQTFILNMAEAAVTSRLAAKYTTPFSSNNYTAHDLIIDMVFVQNMTARQPEKAKALKDSVDERITALLDGSAVMVDSNGAVLLSGVADTVWSNTSTHRHTFGVGAIEDACVSHNALQDEAAERDGEV